MGTYEVVIRKFCNGIAYGVDSYFIDGDFIESVEEAKEWALKQAQARDEDEFDNWEIVSVRLYNESRCL